MSDSKYTATLHDGTNEETIELDLVQGEPQKSFVRAGTVDGAETDVVWELDLGAEEPTYRIADGDGYGEAGTS